MSNARVSRDRSPNFWRRADLRWRLSAGIALVLLSSLSVASLLAVREARRSVGEEIRASMAAAERSLDISLGLLANLDEASAEAALHDWAQAYAYSRHLCVVLGRVETDDYSGQCGNSAAPRAPAWFAEGIGPLPATVQRGWPQAQPRLLLRLLPMPGNEIGEAWATVRGLLLLLIAMAFVINLLVFAWLSYALRPLSGIVLALERMQEGEFELQLPRALDGTPELQRLLAQVSALARQLAQARTQNRRLLLQRLGVQEEERRWVAHELHDEIGQHVAAIEVETACLQGLAQASSQAALRGGLQRIHGLVGEVHCISRRLIQRLRPPALDLLGLAASLRAMGEQWQRHHQGWTLQLEIDESCSRVHDELAIHVFRIVQEALSNVARHADARQVLVRVQMQATQLQLYIADDGRGFDVHRRRSGMGLAGLSERVDALRGSLQVDSARGLGCRLYVQLPLSGEHATRRDEQLRACSQLDGVAREA